MGYPPLLTANWWSCKKVSHDASAGNAVRLLGSLSTSAFVPEKVFAVSIANVVGRDNAMSATGRKQTNAIKTLREMAIKSVKIWESHLEGRP